MWSYCVLFQHVNLSPTRVVLRILLLVIGYWHGYYIGWHWDSLREEVKDEERSSI